MRSLRNMWKRRQQPFDAFVQQISDANSARLDSEVSKLIAKYTSEDVEFSADQRRGLNAYLRLCMLNGAQLAMDRRTDEVSIVIARGECWMKHAPRYLSGLVPQWSAMSEAAVRRGIVHHNKTWGRGAV